MLSVPEFDSRFKMDDLRDFVFPKVQLAFREWVSACVREYYTTCALGLLRARLKSSAVSLVQLFGPSICPLLSWILMVFKHEHTQKDLGTSRWNSLQMEIRRSTYVDHDYAPRVFQVEWICSQNQETTSTLMAGREWHWQVSSQSVWSMSNSDKRASHEFCSLLFLMLGTCELVRQTNERTNERTPTLVRNANEQCKFEIHPSLGFVFPLFLSQSMTPILAYHYVQYTGGKTWAFHKSWGILNEVIALCLSFI